ncbi:ferritin-like domain-containing protein [Deminuibacter soli]|uniref:Ferritin-like domain-containing protein n=1 Tax=Deminuibacter soli TaxID=2291815 RepID=A0A3E1NPG8_9BACT|nr:ferritin-like domain-containing protein [Deminuibacter soli]RFM29724.1 ferritin-like domain-containing protein [Deminuibacter soli]
MNLQNIINEIAEVDPEVYERTSTRRHAFKHWGDFGKKLSLTALPLFFGSVLKKAYGQSTSGIADVLNFALTLEYLEAGFYSSALASTALTFPTADAKAAITTIGGHETAHVNFLKTVISGPLASTPVAQPNVDYTAKGTFPDVFSNYNTFLAVAQTFEDTGVRAYKGQAANVQSNATVLTAALNIHSVEARHASHIRQMRAAAGATVKPWITGNSSGIDSTAVQASYNGEDNVSQGGVTITSLTGVGGNVSANAATESFDEPLAKADVLAIVQPFLV